MSRDLSVTAQKADSAARSLASLARFVLDHQFETFVRVQMDAARAMDLPLMRALAHVPEDVLMQLSREGAREFLEALAEEKGRQYIELSLERWRQNDFGILGKVAVEADDIVGASHLRKKAFFEVLPFFTTSAREILDIVSELEAFSHQYETESFKQLYQFYQASEESKRGFIEKVSNTVPGSLFVRNLATGEIEYENDFLPRHLGYTPEEIGEAGPDFRNTIEHPDDAQHVAEYMAALKNIRDGEVHSLRSRVVRKDGRVLWLRKYDAPFRFDEKGTATHVVGFAFDITAEKEAAESLKESERQLLEAQEIAQLGSFVQDLKAGTTRGTPKLRELMDQDDLSDFENFLSKVHPDDRDEVRSCYLAAVERGDDFDITYRYITSSGQHTLACRGVVEKDEEGNPIFFRGTAQDVSAQQALIDRLNESKARYKEAQALGKIGNWVMTADGDEITWSEQMYHIYEVPPEPGPVDKAALKNRVHPDDSAALSALYQRMLALPGTHEMVFRVTPPAGGIKWVRMLGESVGDEKGQVQLVRGTLQDITEQKQTELRLQQRENFIRKVTDLAPSVITVFNSAANAYEFVNQGLYTLLGYEPDAMLHGGPDFVLARCHPADLPAYMKLTESILSGGEDVGEDGEPVYEGRYRVRDAEGLYRWLHTYTTAFNRAADGALERTLDISLDVTEQVEAEQAAREKEHFVRNITQLVPSVIAVIDVDTAKYVFVNDTTETLLCQPKERFIREGLSFVEEVMHPDDVRKYMDAYETSVRESNRLEEGSSEPLFEVQYRVRNADGVYRWMRSLTTPFLRKNDGSVQQLITITQDVTPLHHAEEVLQQRALQLQQSNASLEEFAYVASHDLQEPLRKIATFGDLLQKSGTLTDERGSAYLTKMIDSARRMQTLINDLLDISVISRQKTFEHHSLHLLLREVLSTLEHKVEATGAIIEADRLPEANVIPAQIRQLFQNLLSNALKFRKKDEPPRISIRCRTLFARDAQDLGLPGSSVYVEVSFTDNGIGFSNEYAQKIFTIFQRLHGRSEYEGSGIGLAICKKIAEHHGGAIWAKGEPGVGATFTVALPV